MVITCKAHLKKKKKKSSLGWSGQPGRESIFCPALGLGERGPLGRAEGAESTLGRKESGHGGGPEAQEWKTPRKLLLLPLTRAPE